MLKNIDFESIRYKISYMAVKKSKISDVRGHNLSEAKTIMEEYIKISAKRLGKKLSLEWNKTQKRDKLVHV